MRFTYRRKEFMGRNKKRKNSDNTFVENQPKKRNIERHLVIDTV